VFLTEHVKTKDLYAIKVIRKDVLIEYDQVESTKLEKDILFAANHPNLVGMDFLFQSDTRLYFVMPFIRGGELYRIFAEQKRFEEDVVKFYAIQIAMGIGELHEQGIMHRDLKLENILIDHKGYVKLIDYGLAKMLGDGDLALSYCGTPEYLSPEMVTGEGHDFTVDWWALGILIYEMLIGVTPFFNKNRNLLQSKIKHARVVFPDRKQFKINYSDNLVDIVGLLLKKDRRERLGAKNGIKEILAHPWFSNLNVNEILA
jgi:serum/glucocorticoid-regulated kinase 2